MKKEINSCYICHEIEPTMWYYPGIKKVLCHKHNKRLECLGRINQNPKTIRDQRWITFLPFSPTYQSRIQTNVIRIPLKTIIQS